MNLRSLQSALILQRVGSFSLAAKEARLTQSAMSQQIGKLEDEIGFLLFDRTRKPIAVTAKGKGFLDRAQHLVLEAEQLWDYAKSTGDRISGEVRIGIIPTLAPYLCPLFIKDLRRTYPDINLHIEEAKTADIIQGMSDRHFNVGILATPIQTDLKLVITPLLYEQFFLFVSEGHSLANKPEVDLAEVDPNECWLLEEGNCFNDQLLQICRWNVGSIGKGLEYHTDHIESLRRIVNLEGGTTFLPELATIDIPSEQEERIKPITGEKRYREISMCHVRNEPTTRMLEAIGELIKSNIPSQMLNAEGGHIIDPGIHL